MGTISSHLSERKTDILLSLFHFVTVKNRWTTSGMFATCQNGNKSGLFLEKKQQLSNLCQSAVRATMTEQKMKIASPTEFQTSSTGNPSKHVTLGDLSVLQTETKNPLGMCNM